MMAEDRSSVEDVDAARRENALIGYQMAISIFTYQGEQAWTRFNVMLFANSIVIAVIGLAITGPQQLVIFAKLLSIVGLLLCGIWFALMEREAKYSDYYILSARELEEKYLSDPVETLSRGGRLAEGSPVTIEIGSAHEELRMSRLARILRAKTAAKCVIVVLAALYIAIIIILQVLL
jgi:hypothetical protein